MSAAAGINWTDIILGSAAAVSAVSAWFSVHITHRRHEKTDRVELMKQSVAEALHPVDVRVFALEQLTAAFPDHLEAAIARAIGPLSSDVGIMKTQIEVVWRSVALDMAKILHKPDPARRHVDVLLEALQNETLTYDEELELRKLLVLIRDWEPGTDVGFPVTDGEQAAAALLLITMEFAIPHRRNNRGRS